MKPHYQRGRRGLFSHLICWTAVLLLPTLAGCTALGVAAHAMPAPPVDAAYKGLAGQTVGVMVWADRGITIDHPTVSLELSKAIVGKLQEAEDAKLDEVKGATYVGCEQIVRFQEDHPELDGEDVLKIAPKLPPMTRLIYVEISNLSMHPNDAVDLVRGDVSTNIKVYEIADGQAVKKYEEHGLSIVYPDKCPPEGVPNLDAEECYHKSIEEMSKEVSIRFFTHEADAE